MSEEELMERLEDLKEEGAILGEDEIKTLLNLIEKQQKQIKLLEEDVDGYKGLSKQIEEDYKYRLEHIGD